MKFIDVILSVIKSLFSSWITKFKENNPSGFRVVGLVLVAISGLSVWIISNGIAPQFDHIIELVGYAAAGLAALFGINQLAAGSKAQVLSKVGDELKANAAHTRTILLSLLFVAAFVASVWLFSKKVPNAPAEETIYLSAAPDAPVEAFSAPAEISNPETGPQPIRPYFVQVLYYRLDTLSSVPTGGLPSFRVIVRRDVTVDFPRVLSSGIPPLSLFQNVRVPGYPNQDRIFNAIILNQ